MTTFKKEFNKKLNLDVLHGYSDEQVKFIRSLLEKYCLDKQKVRDEINSIKKHPEFVGDTTDIICDYVLERLGL